MCVTESQLSVQSEFRPSTSKSNGNTSSDHQETDISLEMIERYVRLNMLVSVKHIFISIYFYFQVQKINRLNLQSVTAFILQPLSHLVSACEPGVHLSSNPPHKLALMFYSGQNDPGLKMKLSLLNLVLLMNT